jgi:BirA family biotin operon repressor/biotin-[acetyl-CoA-carboxylase] ligase
VPEDTLTWEGRDARYWRAALSLPLVQLYGTTTSTNDIARELAEDGAPHLALVIADHQTRGRGRGGKSWVSAPGSSLLCSLIFRYHASGDVAPGAAPVRVGHAVAGAIQHIARAETRVKWPNDIVIPGHGKVAGILCEGAARREHAYLVAGIGINLHSPGGQYASLDGVAERPVSRAVLLTEIIARCRQFADVVCTLLSDTELAAMRPRDVLFGQVVEDENGARGRALGIAPDGSLLVQTGSSVLPIHNATIRLADDPAYPGARA